MMSNGQAGVVWLRPVRYHTGDKLFYQIVAFNKLSDPINFGVEDVQMGFEDGQGIQIYDFDALRRAEREQAQRELVAATVMAGLETWHASRVERRNPHLAPILYQRAANRYYATGDAIAARMEDAILHYADKMLQTTTVDPMTSFGGVVFARQFPIAEGEVWIVLVNVRFAGEDHLFRLRMAADGTPLPVETGIPAVRRRQVEDLFKSCPTWMWTRPDSGCHPAPQPWARPLAR